MARERDFAEQFARALTELTGRGYEVEEDKDGLYVVELKGSPLRYIVRSSLWKAVGPAWPRELLQGLFDGDGGVSVRRRPVQFRVVATLSNSNLELLEVRQEAADGSRRQQRGVAGSQERQGSSHPRQGVRAERGLLGAVDTGRGSVEGFAAHINFRVKKRRKRRTPSRS